jgi:hypothetical protein
VSTYRGREERSRLIGSVHEPMMAEILLVFLSNLGKVRKMDVRRRIKELLQKSFKTLLLVENIPLQPREWILNGVFRTSSCIRRLPIAVKKSRNSDYYLLSPTFEESGKKNGNQKEDSDSKPAFDFDTSLVTYVSIRVNKRFCA